MQALVGGGFVVGNLAMEVGVGETCGKRPFVGNGNADLQANGYWTVMLLLVVCGGRGGGVGVVFRVLVDAVVVLWLTVDAVVVLTDRFK